jgi:hypothetical protein
MKEIRLLNGISWTPPLSRQLMESKVYTKCHLRSIECDFINLTFKLTAQDVVPSQLQILQELTVHDTKHDTQDAPYQNAEVSFINQSLFLEKLWYVQIHYLGGYDDITLGHES